MTRYHKALGMSLIALFGLWGCSRGPASTTGTADRTKLEARLQKVEDDLKSAAAARDQARKRLTDAEEVAARLSQEVERLQSIAKEQDGDLRARTQERDQLQVQYDTFRRSIKDLLGQAETSLKTMKPGANEVVAVPGSGGN